MSFLLLLVLKSGFVGQTPSRFGPLMALNRAFQTAGRTQDNLDDLLLVV
jgi:hypothetical protein